MVCARRFPRRWPAIAGGVLGVLVLLGSFVYPLLVEPLFNDFEPLEDGSLRSSVLALADAEGVDGRRGAGGRRVAAYDDAERLRLRLRQTRRVVLYDTLVQRPARGPGAVGGGARAGRTPARRRAGRLGARARSVSPPWSASAGCCCADATWDGRARCRWCWRCWPWARCSLLRSRTASAGRWRPGPMSRRCATPGTPERFVELQRQLAVRSLSDLTPPGCYGLVVRQP